MGTIYTYRHTLTLTVIVAARSGLLSSEPLGGLVVFDVTALLHIMFADDQGGDRLQTRRRTRSARSRR